MAATRCARRCAAWPHRPARASSRHQARVGGEASSPSAVKSAAVGEVAVERIGEAERTVALEDLRRGEDARLRAVRSLAHRAITLALLGERRVMDDEALARQPFVAYRAAAVQQRRMPEEDFSAPGQEEL